MNLNSEQEKYDLILTSETIYNIDSLQKLYNVIKHSLKRPNGIAYPLIPFYCATYFVFYFLI